ncbi:MAG: hypothetical protein L6461_05305 [Anaerolineae bacterium]|nr:hypothetical protein [Anaerolineae bacterium]
MKTINIIYHLARADFLERTRRYSFLIMLGLVMWLGYAAASGQMIMRIYPDYTGEPNSAWVGTLMALTVTFFLGWFGFYLIKGSVARDYDTGVGQIMATTPLTRPLYMIGKWLSNFAVLGVLILILMAAGILMNLLIGTPLDLWALLAPLVIIALPCMALIAAFAVLFESIGWLRGGFGNVVYFLAFLLLVIPAIETPAYVPLLDVLGFRLIGDSVARAAQAIYPESSGAFTFTITVLDNPKIFPFPGIAWTPDVVLWRSVIFFLGMSTAVLSSVFFDRFNPSRLLPLKKQTEPKPQPASFIEAIASPNPEPVEGHLTPLPATRPVFRFDALFIAELKLLLKGQRWWWYALAAGLAIAQFTNEPEITHILLVVSWLWPILLLSGVGSRESRHNTRQMVFSAPRPVLTQLPAAWLSAFTLIALTGSGAFVKFLALGDTHSLLAWLTGAAFIPSLALTFGILTGSSKTFEIVFVVWMYLILQRVPTLDFVGITPNSPWQTYLGLSIVLLTVSVLARQWQIKSR